MFVQRTPWPRIQMGLRNFVNYVSDLAVSKNRMNYMKIEHQWGIYSWIDYSLRRWVIDGSLKKDRDDTSFFLNLV